jgi:PAS domain S-box-containing protein
MGSWRFGTIRLGKIALVLAMSLFSAAAVYISVLIFELQQALDRVSRYNIAWSASQAVTELGRLEHRVAAYALPGSAVTADEVALRFEILESRLGNLRNGEVDAFARGSPTRLAIIEDLAAAIDGVRPLVDRLDAPGAALQILTNLGPLDAKLESFAAAANRYGGEQVANDQHQLIRLHTVFSALTGGLILSGMGLLGLVFSHNRLLRVERDKTQALAETLSRTSVSKEYLDDIVNSMSEGLLVVTPFGRIEKVNAAAATLTGFTSDALLAMPLAALMPELTGWIALADAVTSNDLRTVSEIATNFGRTLPIRLSSAAMPDGIGGERQIVCVFQSLADHRRAEAEQTQLREQLYQAQKMQAIGTLAGGIAHDFNNILGSMLGHSFLALEDLEENHPAHASLKQILASGERAKALVQQILAYSRNAEFMLEPMIAAKAIVSSLDQIRSAVPAHITLIQTPMEEVTIAGDPTQLHQVLLNLCVNAAHAIGNSPGEIRVAVERIAIPSDQRGLFPRDPLGTGAAAPASDGAAAASRMWFGVAEPGEYCRISVSDNGCGMDRATMARIFEPFFTTKEVGKGTGLGLAAVHGILRNHNGVIAVESAPGGGTRFEIYIPECTIPVAVETPAPAAAPQASKGSQRVMLVDDDQSLLEVTRRTLCRLGYEVVPFSRPEEALKSFKLMPAAWDLVLTDRSMPNMSGEDFAQEVLRTRPDTPVVMATGFSAPEDELRIRDLGVADFLYKPIVGDELAAALQRVLQRAERRRSAA